MVVSIGLAMHIKAAAFLTFIVLRFKLLPATSRASTAVIPERGGVLAKQLEDEM